MPGCTQITFINALSFTDSSLTPATTYNYLVSAEDTWVNEGPGVSASATTPDTVAPQPPSNLGTTAMSGSRIDLYWAPGSDNVGVTGHQVERCTGSGCTGFAYLTTVGGSSYSDTGLATYTFYNYRVRAVDGTGNASPYSNASEARTLDTVAPQAPSGLTTSGIAGTQITLSWTAPTDNVGVTGYLVDRCTGAACTDLTQVGTPTSTSFTHTGLTAATTYRFRVRARDAAGNISDPSSIISAATIDDVAPSPLVNLAGTANSATQVTLTWNASTDNVAVTGYQVERCTGAGCSNFSLVNSPTTTGFVNTGLTTQTTYRYQVRAFDARPNYGSYSTIVTVTTRENQPPSVPGGVSATVISGTQINLNWSQSTDNVGVQDYLVERCAGSGCTSFAQIAIATTTNYSNTGLSGSTLYRYRIRARDAALNVSLPSTIVQGTTPEAQAPTAPANLSASIVSSTQINLTWSPSTDNVGVTGYAVERCSGAGCTGFAQVATPTATSYNNTSLSVTTTYRFQVRARDAAGNWSPPSSIVTATTPAPTIPTVPQNLRTTTVWATQIVLAWNPSIDDVGVVNYLVERCSGAACSTFTQVDTPTGTSSTSTGLTPGATYRFQVRARDGSNNTSSYSTILNVTTPSDVMAPSTPGGLTVTSAPNQLLLSWNQSTDNSGSISAYLIERCTGSPCNYSQIASVPTTSYTDTAVAVATTYSYRVRARDAAGNLSNWSTVTPGVPAQCD